jgi:hypothetical protein
MIIDDIADTPLVTAWRRDDQYGVCQQLCSEMNSWLRHGSASLSGGIAVLVSEFDAFFEHNALPAETRIYRACPRSTIEQVITAGTMIYPAFMSTSNSIEKASLFHGRINLKDHPVYLHLVLKEETRTVDAQSRLYDGIGEGEFVLPRGMRLTFQQTLEDDVHEIIVSNT